MPAAAPPIADTKKPATKPPEGEKTDGQAGGAKGAEPKASGKQGAGAAKEGAGKGVVSRVTPLDREGRIEEIARMLGGVTITPTTRKHAAEMLGY